ncbi:MAG: alpha/beta fold hydrolase [Candidatus Hermodarchaeia archaeon]
MYLQVLGFLMGKVVQSKETLVKANEIELCYDTFGESTDPPMLLIMGLGAQMIRWDEAFCKQLASSGFWVIRYDNRDVGKSTKFEAAGVPNAMELRLKAQQGEPLSVPYTLEDMALDAVGLLDALNIKQAHVVGVSMGGMIAQTIAIHHSERVRTLTSIMSSTGNRPHYLIDDAYVRQYAGRAFDRSFYPQGTARQLGAILASGSRKEALKTVQIPTLVIHGDADPLVPIEGGKDTTASIPGAKLFIIKGMGHDIPAKVAPQIIEAIQNHAV